MKRKMNELLKRVFGYDAFRPGQEQIITAILNGRDVMAVLPTGGGKSLSYQVPALMLPGVSIVVSPLISLMKDQVDQLVELSIDAVMINGTMSADEVYDALNSVRRGRIKLLYVAPERMESQRFMDMLGSLDVPLLVVDEAHCVSQWGHDFRPAYLQISNMVNSLPKRPVVAAFTATATQMVRDDIERQLELQEPVRVVTGFDRPNLRFAVENKKPSARPDHIARYALERPDLPGIVYCATRKRVEDLTKELRDRGVNALGYHAGMSDEDRSRNQEAFIDDEVTVMVATNAFGMGIDKSNVRYVIHDGMSGSVEAYWQEAGRAGRDGEAAECILLYSAGDQFVRKTMIDSSEADEEHKQQEYRKLRIMEQYAQTDGCLRNYILNYFGEKRTEPCFHCSNCENPADNDVTREAQMVLSCVARMERTGRRYGAGMLRDVLMGSGNAKLKQARLDENPCYGLMKGMDGTEVAAFIQRLVQDGLLIVSGEYPVVSLAESAAEVLRGDAPVMHRHPAPGPKEKAAKRKKTGSKQGTRPETDRVVSTEVPARATQAADPLLKDLKELRMQISKEIRKPPFMVFSDATLYDMLRKKPRTLDELEQVNGVGAVKREKYGKRFINIFNRSHGSDGLHRRMASRAAIDVLMAHRNEWIGGMDAEQAQDAYDYVLDLLENGE